MRFSQIQRMSLGSKDFQKSSILQTRTGSYYHKRKKKLYANQKLEEQNPVIKTTNTNPSQGLVPHNLLFDTAFTTSRSTEQYISFSICTLRDTSVSVLRSWTDSNDGVFISLEIEGFIHASRCLTLVLHQFSYSYIISNISKNISIFQKNATLP